MDPRTRPRRTAPRTRRAQLPHLLDAIGVRVMTPAAWSMAPAKSLDPLEHQSAVGAAKPERVFHRYVNMHVARSVGAVVKIALRILVEDIDSGRGNLVMQRQCRDYGLDAARATQQVSSHRLGRVAHQIARCVPERCLNRVGLV